MKSIQSRISFLLAVAGIGVTAMLMSRALVQADSQPNAAPNPYRAVEGWGKPLPDARQWGSTNAITVDSKDNIWVGERCGSRTNCVDSPLDPFLNSMPPASSSRAFGAGCLSCLTASMSTRGGNIWATDNSGKDGKGQQVIKFSPDGKGLDDAGESRRGRGRPGHIQSAGRRRGRAQRRHFRRGRPHGRKGQRAHREIFEGRKVHQAVGRARRAPASLKFRTDCHRFQGRHIRRRPQKKRIQIFDQDGKFLAEWKQFGAPSGLFIDNTTNSMSRTPGPGPDDPKKPTAITGIRTGHSNWQREGRQGDGLHPDPPSGGCGDKMRRKVSRRIRAAACMARTSS